ncbi:unnamed protein product [Penicillium camemberti]|uniref:Str. FM013 n=1 Tax=Penicillium camemberti (strain FM 013) TaxID=1429867 RepID=A0A0G4NU19_PENC3|nr:unnamed protein product [Penicillium camemberti]
MAYNMLNVSQPISIPHVTHPNTLPVTLTEKMRNNLPRTPYPVLRT